MTEVQEERKYINFEYELFDGEEFITFNLVDLDLINDTITVAISNRGKISVITYDLMADEDGLFYFEYGPMNERIYFIDFEEV